MKRNSQVLKHKIFSHYGLFSWQECLFCKQEFIREKGYRFQLQFGHSDWSYSCENCCISKAHCDSMITNWIATSRPKNPPAPPPRKP